MPRHVDRRGRRAAAARRPRWLQGAAAVLAVGLAACQSMGLEKAGGKVVAAPVGNNLVGESCRVASAPGEEAMPVAKAKYDVFCGKWEQPSARIMQLDGTTTPEQQASGGSWRDRLNTFTTCQPPLDTTVLDGVPAVALDCALKRGGWPYQAVAIKIGNDVFVAESIPASFPAMEQAVGIVSGRFGPVAEGAETKQSAEMARLQARAAGAFYSAGDLQDYRDLLRLALYYNFQGNFAEAEKRYRGALALQQKTAPADVGGEAFILMSLALELSNQERFAQAEAMFKRVDNLVPASLDPSDDPRLLSYRAIHLANQQQADKAATMAHQATEARLALAKDYGPATNANFDLPALVGFVPSAGGRASGQVLTGRGEAALGDVVQSKFVEAAMLLREGQLDRADRTLAEAVAVFESVPQLPRRWLSQIDLLQSGIAERRGNLSEAGRLARLAIKDQQATSGRSRTEGMALVTLGRIEAAQGQTANALVAFRSGFAMIRENGGDLRFAQALPYFNAALAEARRTPAEAEVLYGEMFEVAQMVRGGVTAQTLALATARLAGGTQQVSRPIRNLQDARRERDVINERLTLAQADPNTLPPQLDALDREWATINARIADLEREVQAAAPRYNQILDTPVSAERVREALAPDEALAQVLVGSDGAIGFFVDAHGIAAYSIDLNEHQAAEIVATLRTPFDQSKYTPYNTPLAHDLFLKLFGPVRDRLAAARQLIVVPSGPLLSLPMAILVEEPPAPGGTPDYTRTAWLVRNHTLTVTPSVQSFFNLRTTAAPSQSKEPFIGFGDFVPLRDVESVLKTRGLPEACRKDVIAVASMPALPNTAVELRAVANALATSERIVLGEAFSVQTVKTTQLSDYQVVYFATHGLLPYELNCLNEPSLITSKSSAEKDDGLLTASEVMNLKLDADLVVLSACNTGGPGIETGGESLSGLARAFFYAGARSMVVTHWSVYDKPTVQLMVSTFEQLGTSSVTPAEAMRRSQLRLIEDPRSAHPVYWGAFDLVGDGGRRFSPVSKVVAAQN